MRVLGLAVPMVIRRFFAVASGLTSERGSDWLG
jgi:hypothetical protein